jgi:hypothetical protein
MPCSSGWTSIMLGKPFIVGPITSDPSISASEVPSALGRDRRVLGQYGNVERAAS